MAAYVPDEADIVWLNFTPRAATSRPVGARPSS
jgi:hypothetical protein